MSQDKDHHRKSLASKYVEIVMVVSLYWIVSISMVFLNKSLLSSKDIKLDAPLFITLFQCCCSAAICLIAAFITTAFPHLKKSIPIRVELDPSTLVKVLPLSIVFVAMITFNNLCLKYVGVAFYFVGRSLTTVFNVILTYTLLGQRTSIRACICCLIILIGFFMGVDQESEHKLSMPTNTSHGDDRSIVNEDEEAPFSWMGVVFGVLASLFVSLQAIKTKSVLPVVKNSIWVLSWYNNLNSMILLFLLMLVTGEVETVTTFDKLGDVYFWSMMILSGIFGFAIGFVTGLQIQVTSPLTHNISGTAKAAAQTVLAVVWFAESKTVLWWISNLMVMLGSAFYARVKQLEMMKMHKLGARKDSSPTDMGDKLSKKPLLKDKESEV